MTTLREGLKRHHPTAPGILGLAVFMAETGLGRGVFPLARKNPPAKDKLSVEGRGGVYLASQDPTRIEEMFDILTGFYTVTNYAVATGNFLAVVDCDMSDDGAPVGHDNWLRICDEHGWSEVIERTFRVETPSGGMHYYLRVPDDPSLRSGRNVARTDRVDLRVAGGYVVGPGSQGGKYRPVSHDLSEMSPPMLRALVEPAPPEMVAWLTSGRRAAGERRAWTGEADPSSPSEDWNRRCGDGLAAVLEFAGWTLVRADGDTEYWRRPGKGDGHSATLARVGDGGVPIFYNFSSNAAPFADEQGYTPAGVLAMLQFDGDYGACARALRAKGYGGGIADVDRNKFKFDPDRCRWVPATTTEDDDQ